MNLPQPGMSEVYLIHTTTMSAPPKQLWIVFDEYVERRAQAGTRKAALAKWISRHGQIAKIKRYAGKLLCSEAAVTLADHELKKPKAEGKAVRA